VRSEPSWHNASESQWRRPTSIAEFARRRRYSRLPPRLGVSPLPPVLDENQVMACRSASASAGRDRTDAMGAAPPDPARQRWQVEELSSGASTAPRPKWSKRGRRQEGAHRPPGRCGRFAREGTVSRRRIHQNRGLPPTSLDSAVRTPVAAPVRPTGLRLSIAHHHRHALVECRPFWNVAAKKISTMLRMCSSLISSVAEAQDVAVMVLARPAGGDLVVDQRARARRGPCSR
jgi:hypothetical protein